MIFGFQSSAKNRSEKDRAEKIANKLQVELHEYLQLICVPNKTSWVFQGTGTRSFPCIDEHKYHVVLLPFAAILNSLKEISEKRGRPKLGPYMVPYQITD